MDAEKITVGNIRKTNLWRWSFPPAKDPLGELSALLNLLLGPVLHSFLQGNRRYHGYREDIWMLVQDFGRSSSHIHICLDLRGVSFCHIRSVTLMQVKSVFQTPDF